MAMIDKMVVAAQARARNKSPQLHVVVGSLMRSPDIMSDLEVISELAAITEEHHEHDIRLTPELVRSVTQNTWFESDIMHRHYIIIDQGARVVISAVRSTDWIPNGMMVVTDKDSHSSELKSTLTSNVIAVRVLASNLPVLNRIFSFILDKAPPGGIVMTKMKHNAQQRGVVRKRPPPKHKH